MLGWAGHAKAQGARVLMPLLSPWEKAACYHQHHGVLLSSWTLPGPADLSERNEFANAQVLLPGPSFFLSAGVGRTYVCSCRASRLASAAQALPAREHPLEAHRKSLLLPNRPLLLWVSLGFFALLCIRSLFIMFSIHLLGKFQNTAFFFKVGIQGKCTFIDSAGSLFSLGGADASAS